MTTLVPEQWLHNVLCGIGTDDTEHRRFILKAWAASKHMPDWAHNPLACGSSYREAKILTASGIRQYEGWGDSALSTISALQHHDYHPILRALQRDYTLLEAWNAVRATTWPWVRHDQRYPEMMLYLGEIEAAGRGYREPPVITDGLHGGYPRSEPADHLRWTHQKLRTTIGVVAALGNDLHDKMRKGYGRA